MGLNFNGNWLDTAGPAGGGMKGTSSAGPCSTTAPTPTTTSLIWELPFFRNSSGVTRAILGGWEVANITTLTSGQTFPVNVGIDILDLGAAPERLAGPDRGRGAAEG